MDLSDPWSQIQPLLAQLEAEASTLSRSLLSDIAEKLLTTLLLVRTAFNATCPVNHLPPEIFTEIFGFCSPPLDPYPDDSPRITNTVWPSLFDFKDVGKLVPLTHVCRHWRDVALQAPSLWTTIHGRSKTSTANTCISRSQAAGLKVAYNGRSLGTATDLCRTIGPQIQTLFCDVATFDYDFVRRRSQFPELPGDIMENLGVLATALDPELVPPSPPRLWSEDIPLLKVLVWRGIQWFPVDKFGNLTHLFIERTTMPVARLLGLLSDTPRLKDLGLYNLCESDSSESRTRHSSPHAPRPALSHLRRLSISNPDERLIYNLLTHLVIPAHVAISFEDCDASTLRWLPPLEAFQDLTCIRISSDDSVVAVNTSTAVRFHTSSDIQRPQYRTWLKALMSFLHMGAVREVWLEGMHSLGEKTRLEILLPAIPSLSVLHIRCECFRALKGYLSLSADPPRCAHLTSLRLFNSPFSIWPEEISELVASREAIGYPLQQIIFMDAEPTIVLRYIELADLKTIRSRGPDDASVMPMPEVCTVGVSSPHFWPKQWYKAYPY